jgi:hypothetical protein
MQEDTGAQARQVVLQPFQEGVDAFYRIASYLDEGQKFQSELMSIQLLPLKDSVEGFVKGRAMECRELRDALSGIAPSSGSAALFPSPVEYGAASMANAPPPVARQPSHQGGYGGYAQPMPQGQQQQGYGQHGGQFNAPSAPGGQWSSPPSSPAAATSTEWDCSACTYKNALTAAACVMCGTKPPPAPAYPTQTVAPQPHPAGGFFVGGSQPPLSQGGYGGYGQPQQQQQQYGYGGQQGPAWNGQGVPPPPPVPGNPYGTGYGQPAMQGQPQYPSGSYGYPGAFNAPR